MSFVLDPVLHPLCFEDFIRRGRGIRRRVIPAQKPDTAPVLMPERAWEGRGVVYPSVWRRADGRWGLWYMTSEGQNAAYAESADGVRWQRPALGRVRFNGTTDNNLFYNGELKVPVVQYFDDAAPESRFRMALHNPGQHLSDGCIRFFRSSEGIDWTPIEDATQHLRSDTQPFFTYLAAQQRWALYHRPGMGYRSMVCSVSSDGMRFSPGGPMGGRCFEHDAHDEAFGLEQYALTVFSYDGGYIGMLKVFANRWDDKRCWIELVCSRDGVTWQRLSDRRPFISLGENGAWDSLCMTPGHSLVSDETGNGHWFYYDCWNARHTRELNEPHARACIGRAYIPRRRLVEAVAEGDPSMLWTESLRLTGDTLTLDYDARGGHLHAHVQYEDGTVPPGFNPDDATPLNGTGVGEIHFRGGSLAQFDRLPVRIVVHMTRGARLYALGVL